MAAPAERLFRHEHFAVEIANRRLSSHAALKKRLRGTGDDGLAVPWPCGAGSVYVFRDERGRFMYVGGSAAGERYTPFDTISRGLSRQYSYKFASKDQKVQIDLFAFGLPPKCSEIDAIQAPNRVARFIEAIEAEVVFLIRARTGKWPAHQHEIHFQPTLCTLPIVGKAVGFVGRSLGSLNLRKARSSQ
jgi:hypothetical protein